MDVLILFDKSLAEVWWCCDLLLLVRLLVRMSDEGPLLVFAASIATLMSSIHRSISASELEWTENEKNAQHVQMSNDNVTRWINAGLSVLPNEL